LHAYNAVKLNHPSTGYTYGTDTVVAFVSCKTVNRMCQPVTFPRNIPSFCFVYVFCLWML